MSLPLGTPHQVKVKNQANAQRNRLKDRLHMEMQLNTIHHIIVLLENNKHETKFDRLRKNLNKYEQEAAKTAKGFEGMESAVKGMTGPQKLKEFVLNFLGGKTRIYLRSEE